MPDTGYPPAGSDVELIFLTFWDKVAIAAGAVGFLLLVALCMVCVLCPDCLLHAFCCADDRQDGEQKKKKKNNSSKKSTSSYGSVESDYYYGSPGSQDQAKWKPMDILKEQQDTSDWSSDTGQDTIQLESLKNQLNSVPETNGLTNGDLHPPETITPLQNGTLHYSLEYSQSEERLAIKVLEVLDLESSEGRELTSPYLKIRLYRTPKQFFTFRGSSVKDHVINNLEKELKTKMQRPAEVLSYKESFGIHVQPDVLASFTVKFLLCDMDKLSRHVILGETSAILRKIDLSTEREFHKKLDTPIQENLGSVLLGLSYLPTSEKMYLYVESASGLSVMDKRTNSTDACVKAYLMYDGKQLKRVKSTVRSKDLNPVFNESFSFDVPQNDLGQVYVSVVVCHYNAEKKNTHIIGRIYLGMIFDEDARNHWISMMCNPRKKIVNNYKILS